MFSPLASLPSLLNKNSGAMSLYETIAPQRPMHNPLRKIGAAFGRGIRAMQYARMMRALSELSDEKLDAAGIDRSDIPRRAHDCVYADRP